MTMVKTVDSSCGRLLVIPSGLLLERCDWPSARNWATLRNIFVVLAEQLVARRVNNLAFPLV